MPVIKRVTFTKNMVESVRGNPGGAPYRLWDSKVPGLALRVLPTHRSTYEVHWGRNKALKLGTNGAMTLDAARAAAKHALSEVTKHGAPLAAKKGQGEKVATFGEFIQNRYGPYVIANNKAGHATVAALKAQFGYLFNRPLAEITREDFALFKTKRRLAGISPSTINRDMDRLKAALSQAVEWDCGLAENPIRGVKRITRDIEERVRYLSPNEEAALRAALETREVVARARRQSGNKWREDRGEPLLPEIEGYSDHLMPMALLALNTGMRRGEITQLTWADVSLEAKRVTVRASSAKSGKARHIPLNAEAHAVLQAYQRQHSGKGKLFDLVSVTKSWKSLMEAAGIEDFRFHDLRHTFASNLVMAGVDLNTVRELLGHGDIKMTLRYAHLAPEHKAAAVELLTRRELAESN